MAILLAAAALPASGQTVVDGRVWAGLAVQGRTGTQSSGRWWVDSLFRTRDGVETADLVAVRGLLGLDVTSRSSLWAGYAAAAGFPPDGGAVTEHRVFEQFLWSGGAFGGGLSLRTRFEQRFVEGDRGVALRARQQVRLSHPLPATRRLSIIVWDEVMVYLRSTSRSARGFDQHRVFGGLQHALAGGAGIEAGYLNQYVRGASGTSLMNHVLIVTLGVTVR